LFGADIDQLELNTVYQSAVYWIFVYIYSFSSCFYQMWLRNVICKVSLVV